jgi:hypothetical protein
MFTNGMTVSLVIPVGLAALVFSGLFSLNQSQYGIQEVSAQSDEQHFKDCRSRFLEFSDRWSKILDRYENGEDITTEMNSVIADSMVISSDCKDIEDRLAKEPAIIFQTNNLNERMRALGLGNATETTKTVEEQDVNSQLNGLVDFCIDKLPAGTPECDNQLREVAESACKANDNALDACQNDKVDQYYRTRSKE